VLAATEVPVGSVGVPAPPGIRAVLTRAAASLATAVLVPAFLLWAMLVMFDFAAAVIVVLAWMAGAMCWRRATGRRVSTLLLLGLVVMTLRTALTLVTGSTFVYLVQPVFVDVVIAAVFLGSLWTAQPVIARMAPDFYPMDDVSAARPEVRTHFQRLTVMWGLVMLVKGCITLWLLESLSTVDFVLIKSLAIFSVTLAATAVTVVWSSSVIRQGPLLRHT
jgi:intracellular septation protein A